MKKEVRRMEDKELVQRILRKMMMRGETGTEGLSAAGEMWNVMEDVREERRRRVRGWDRSS